MIFQPKSTKSLAQSFAALGDRLKQDMRASESCGTSIQVAVCEVLFRGFRGLSRLSKTSFKSQLPSDAVSKGIC